MTNPTDTGGENPTIRDVSPPSDTNRCSISIDAAAWGSWSLGRSVRLPHRR